MDRATFITKVIQVAWWVMGASWAAYRYFAPVPPELQSAYRDWATVIALLTFDIGLIFIPFLAEWIGEAGTGTRYMFDRVIPEPPETPTSRMLKRAAARDDLGRRVTKILNLTWLVGMLLWVLYLCWLPDNPQVHQVRYRTILDIIAFSLTLIRIPLFISSLIGRKIAGSTELWKDANRDAFPHIYEDDYELPG